MNPESECAMLIREIHTELEKNANNSLRQQDITFSQVSVLMELDASVGNRLDLKTLEKNLHVAQSTTVGIVHRLEKKNLVEVAGCQDDKRAKMVQMTKQGKERCECAKEYMIETEQKLTHSLSEEEKQTLALLLRKVRESYT